MTGSVRFELEFIEKKKESRDAYTFYFKRPDNFYFFSGQYIKIFLRLKNSDERGTSRYFTISSSPTEKEYLSITTRIIKSSFKLAMNEFVTGQKVSCFGPIGYFDFNPDQNKDIVLISGGIGITPYHSLIKFLDDKKIKIKVLLISSFDNEENVVFFKELKKIEARNNLFKFIYTLTKERNPEASFKKGKIDENMIKKYVRNFTSPKYYITGPQSMVENMYSLLLSVGIPDEKIFKEDFPGY